MATECADLVGLYYALHGPTTEKNGYGPVVRAVDVTVECSADRIGLSSPPIGYRALLVYVRNARDVPEEDVIGVIIVVQRDGSPPSMDYDLLRHFREQLGYHDPHSVSVMRMLWPLRLTEEGAVALIERYAPS